MDTQLLSRLNRLTGSLKPSAETSLNDLNKLNRKLAEELIKNPDLNISGHLPHHEGAEAESTIDLSERFRHLSDLFERKEASAVESSAPAPLVFRRETAFRNNFLGNSVPSWGTGMEVSQSFGPFINEFGSPVWFDFFFAIKTVKVFIQGETLPALLIPVRGIITARDSYRIEAGSIWIASHLIAKTPVLKGFYTGLKIEGGSLNLSANPIINSGNIIIHPAITADLQVQLRQNPSPTPSPDAGFDAQASVIELPKTLGIKFNAANSSITASDASCTVFGTEARFRFANLAPVFIDFLSQILIPYTVSSNSDDPANFNIQSSLSKLCTFDKAAGIDINSGWLLPAAKIDPSLLGEAAGTGSLCIGLKNGINAIWKGLKGGRTKFNHPAIIAEPGMLTVIDFFAENNYGKQKWELWQNAGSKHHSEISIGFGKLFPFVFISSSKGTETILYFCNHRASFDRPVDANGSPFKIESTVALGSIVQTGKTFLASLFDNDLLFDGNFNKPEAYKKNSIALRNALFTVTSPYSLFLTGELENDNKIIKGSIAISFGIHQYLPTLPDPYVASFTTQLRGQRAASSNLQLALVAFVKWPNKGEAPNPEDGVNDWAYLYFRFAPLNFPLATARASLVNTDTGLRRTDRDFRTGVATFNNNIAATNFVDKSSFSINSLTHEPEVKSLQSSVNQNLSDTISRSVHSGEINEAIADLDANPLLRSINDKANKVSQVLDAALQNNTRSVLTGFSDNAMMMNNPANMDSNSFAVSDNRGLLYARDNFMLLDVSTNADLMGVSFGTSFNVDRDDQGNTRLTKLNVFTNDAANANAFPLQILNMDVVAEGRNVRAVTLPQISWEPVTNIPLEIEGKFDPLDTITVTPGLLVYDNDGIPTRIFSESPYQVPITPLSVTHHFLKEYNDKKIPRQLHSVFTLPFAIIAQAAFQRNINEPENKNARLHFNMPWFDQSRGGLQIKVEAPDVEDKNKESRKPSFPGWTLQLEENIKWFLFGIPVTGSTLGNTVKLVFNDQFSKDQPEVPLERMEISGYGASIFSDWFDKKAAIAKVSQAKFDVIVGRTGSEVIQIRSIMYPYAVHVVRTITLTRSPNGYVFRSDSGWKAESDGFFDFDYTINFKKTFADRFVDNPYNIHNEVVKGVSNVREIRDYPDGGLFTSSFNINDPGLPTAVLGMSLPEWQSLFNGIAAGGKLDVKMQAVVFDADVHMRNITSGGVFDSASGDYKVQSRKMLGYVQLSPSSILVPGHVFADLLKFQNGSLGGSVDSIMNIALSKQRMRITRVDVNPAFDAAGKPVFVSAARGSLLLPQDGSWSVVKQHTDSGDIKPLEDGQTVPLIKTNGSGNYRIANPADILVSTSSKINYGVLQSTGTQKLLFDIPQFKNGVEKLLSNQTFFADAYKLLNSKGPFPNIVNALQLTNAEKEVAILGEGLMKMADRDIDVASLLPSKYQYVFIEEPDILKVYAEYKSTGGDNGNLKLGIDSTAAHADKWKAALSNVRIVVDLGPIQELVWVDGNFNASNGISSKLDKPNLQFGPVLQPVVDILRVLAMLTGDDFDEGMKVGMSNSPDNWEYKFDCSKEIPVIKFPSPLQLSINPNPPLKLEAGLKVGFYFNQMLSIPTDIKQLVPACGAYVEFYGRMQVQCFTLGAASIYAVGQVVLGMAADTKAGKILYMKVGFGIELVVGLPVVGNVTVLYMVEVEVKLGETSLTIGALMLFRGSAEICGGLVGICIQIEAGGSIERDLGGTDRTNCIAQVTFSIDVCVLWVIDINFTDRWEETRQIS